MVRARGPKGRDGTAVDEAPVAYEAYHHLVGRRELCAEGRAQGPSHRACAVPPGKNGSGLRTADLAGQGVGRFVEVGAGGVLTGLLRTIDASLAGLKFGEPADLDALGAAGWLAPNQW